MTPEDRYAKRIAASLKLFEDAEPVKMAELRVKALRTLRLSSPPRSRLGIMVFDARYTEMVREYKGWPTLDAYTQSQTASA